MKHTIWVFLFFLVPFTSFAGDLCEKIDGGVYYGFDRSDESNVLFFAVTGRLAEVMAQAELPYRSSTISDFQCWHSFCGFNIFQNGTVKRATFWYAKGNIWSAHGEVCRDNKSNAIVSIRVQLDEDSMRLMAPSVSIEHFLGLHVGCGRRSVTLGAVRCFATSYCQTKDGSENQCEIIFDGKGKAL